MRHIIKLIGLVICISSSSANATIAYKGSVDLGNNISSPGTVYSSQYTVNTASNFLAVTVLNNNSDSTTFKVTDNGVTMTPVVCSGGKANVSNSAGLPFLFYLFNPTSGTHDVVVTASSPVGMQVLAADYSGVGAFESCLPDNGTSPLTSTIGVKNVNDWAIIVAAGYATQTAGAGDVLRVNDAAFNEFGLFDSNAGLTIGNHSFTTSLSGTNNINHLVATFTPANPGPQAVSVNCVPPNPTLPDSSLSATVVCALTVTMSDGSTYSGTNTVTPSSTFAVPASGKGNLTISRALTPADDGELNAAVCVTQNNGTKCTSIGLTVTPTTASGTPFPFGWKNIDPGSGPVVNGWSNDGETIFVAPHIYTVNQVLFEVVSPTSTQGLVDVYLAHPGQACSAGSKIHSGDFHTSQPIDTPQVLPVLVSSMGVHDRLCVITQQPFPTSGQAFVQVTAQ